MLLLCLYFFLIPAGLLIYDLNDPGLASDATPRCVFRWHRSLSPKYERWARQRLALGPAPGLEEAGVAILPGAAFGRPREELTARIAYVDFDGAAALSASEMIPLDQPLPEDFTELWCHGVIKAIRLLIDWVTH